MYPTWQHLVEVRHQLDVITIKATDVFETVREQLP